MAARVSVKTTFEPSKVIEPIYTGGVVSLDDDGRILASAVEDSVVLTDINTGKRLAAIGGDGEAITTLTLTPLASHLIICSRSLSLRIYSIISSDDSDAISVTLSRSLKPYNSPVVSVAVDRSGSLLSTGSADGIVKVWDIRGGFTTHTLHGHGGVISALRFFQMTDSETSKHEPESRKKKGQGQKLDEHMSNSESNEGYRLASGSEDGKIRIWDLHRRKCIAILDSHVSVVRSLDFDSRKGLLLSGSRDKTAMLWSTTDWKLHTMIAILETVETAGFIPQSQYIYTGGERGCLRLWDLDTAREVTENQPPGNESQSIIQGISSRSLEFIFCVHADQTFTLHSLSTLSTREARTLLAPLPLLRRISGTHDEVIDLAYIGLNQDFLAVATNMEEIRILSLQEAPHTESNGHNKLSSINYFGADVGILKGHSDIIICLDTDWSGQWLITGAKDNTARLWKVNPQQHSYTCYAILTGHAESIGAVALPKRAPALGTAQHNSPLEYPPEFIITGSQDKTVKRWDTKTLGAEKGARATYTRKAHDKDINALDVNPNSTLFASASQDRTVKIWSIEDGETAGILRGHRRGVWSVKFAPPNLPPVSGEAGQSTSARGLILTGSGDKSVKIWSLNDYSCLKTFEGHTNSVLKVLWLNSSHIEDENDVRNNSKQSVQIVSSGGDGLVKIWNAISEELECTLDNHTDRVWALALHRSANTLISGGGDGVLTFWNNTTSSNIAAAAAASTARVEQDQELQNYIRQGAYRSAITLALQLNHPGRLLALFTSVVGTFPPEVGSLSGSKSVDEVLANLEDEQLYLLFLRVRDWNANVKTAPVAQKILWVLLKTHSSSKITNLRPPPGTQQKNSSITDVISAINAYTERQYQRLEELIDESYLVEHTLKEMGDFDVVDFQSHDNTTNSRIADVVMLDEYADD